MLGSVKISFIRYGKKYLHLDNFMRALNYYLRKLLYLTHKIQYEIEWSVENPEHFDHFIDLHFKWKRDRTSFPMERGVFGSLALHKSKGSGKTLDLCCGDGFYSYYYYSAMSQKITAIDFDPFAIKWAKKNYNKSNIKFILADIRTNFPQGQFDNIMWDAAIEHFTEVEILNLMKNIKTALGSFGILSGYTIKERDGQGKHLHQHEYEFHDMEDLARFLKPYFKNISIIETKYSSRTNFYFYASDNELPLEGTEILKVRG